MMELGRGDNIATRPVTENVGIEEQEADPENIREAEINDFGPSGRQRDQSIGLYHVRGTRPVRQPANRTGNVRNRSDAD
jgi:hypothetical protein